MYTIPLPQAADHSLAGGKAANLAFALRSGFPVPGGFVLSRAALNLFLETNRIMPTVKAVLNDYNGITWQKRPEKSGQAQPKQPRQVSLPGEAKRVFQGEGIAPGKTRGVAYLLSFSSPTAMDDMDRLTSEHILICGRDEFNAQWRRDWYAMFMIVRGLVTVQGAQLHHATQIARECGIPFKNLPEEELGNLPNGVPIEIDGQAGTLMVL